MESPNWLVSCTTEGDLKKKKLNLKDAITDFIKRKGTYQIRD